MSAWGRFEASLPAGIHAVKYNPEELNSFIVDDRVDLVIEETRSNLIAYDFENGVSWREFPKFCKLNYYYVWHSFRKQVLDWLRTSRE